MNSMAYAANERVSVRYAAQRAEGRRAGSERRTVGTRVLLFGAFERGESHGLVNNGVKHRIKQRRGGERRRSKGRVKKVRGEGSLLHSLLFLHSF